MIKIGLMGLGTVGSGVYKIMKKNNQNIEMKVGTEVKIEKILVNNKEKERGMKIDKNLITDNPDEILNNEEIDLIVELIGGENPAYKYITDALSKGKSVVTANKMIIAKYGKEILKLAKDNNVQINFEGSVAGGIPIIRPLKESLAANRIKEINGILNGTTNYILTQMTEEKMEFAEVLKIAQEKGYAENDPSSDIDGLDAAYKICILSSLAFETIIDMDAIYVEGIRNIASEDINIADELGYVIKLLAIAKHSNGGLDIRVHPAFVPCKHPLALVNSVYNAVYIYGDAVGDVMSHGKGAGQMPTGSAVVADIIKTAHDIHFKHFGNYFLSSVQKHKIKNIDEVSNKFYLRIQVNDKPGVMAKVAKALGDNNVSLASVLQKHRLTPVVPLILITHPVQEKNLNNALKKLNKLHDVVEISNKIRVIGEE